MASSYLKPRENLQSWIRSAVIALRRGDTEKLRALLISVYTVYTEKEQSQGRSDCIVETDDYIYIFEFKRDGSADEALAQIEAKGYARPYEADKRKLYKIGVNFSSETGTVEEWKVG